MRNLLPEFRHYIEEKDLRSLDDIERYGRRLERRKEIDRRYVPPPRDRMRIPGAAFEGGSKVAKVAAAAILSSNSGSDSDHSGRASKSAKRRQRQKTTKAGSAVPVMAAVASTKPSLVPQPQRNMQAHRPSAGVSYAAVLRTGLKQIPSPR